MDDWNIQHGLQCLRVIRSAARLLRCITDYWSLITDHRPLAGIPAR
jgi:hypothetical protein